MNTIIKRDGYTVELSAPEIYVDNKSRGRSGHMSHALAEFEPNKIIDFNSNCSAKKHGGHATYGFIEYRISEDGGKTYSEVFELPYAKQAFFDGVEMISVEKAVACNDGSIVAICLRNDPNSVCQPWDTPTFIKSVDGGKTWSEPKELCSFKGRVYDACYYKGIIYVLEFCNDGTGLFIGEKPEHVYRIFTSNDNGESFSELCVIPMDTLSRGYGSMVFDDEGFLHVYAYNYADEVNMDHAISRDLGKTWEILSPCYLAYGIRNPQVNVIDGIFVCHGRNKDCSGFVLYTSLDGSLWDNGEIIGTKQSLCYYSNNIVLKDDDGSNHMLIQYSESYENACVDVMHRWLKIKK